MSAAPPILFAHAVYDLAREFAQQGGAGPVRSVRSQEELLCLLADTEYPFVQWPGCQRQCSLRSRDGARARLVSTVARCYSRSGSQPLDRHDRNPASRQAELDGKSMVILGMGRIGARLARLAQAFGMLVTGVRRSPGTGAQGVEIVPPTKLKQLAAEADVLAITCPLTPKTDGLVDGEVIGAMKRTAFLINVARGRVVDEVALATALQNGHLSGAGLDCFYEEPLPPTSPLWSLSNVIITPHTAGETQSYERNVAHLLIENLRVLQTNSTLINSVSIC